MPSKSSQHIAFFLVLFVSLGLHWYVFNNLKRVLQRDYPKIGKRLTHVFLGLFILMDSPFLFLWFQGKFHATMLILNHVIVYPFLVWQTILLMWAIILCPVSLLRRTKTIIRYFVKTKESDARRDSEPELALEIVAE